MTSDPKHQLRPRRKRRLAMILLAVVALVVGGLFAVARSGDAARTAAIDRIKMANEPLLPDGLKAAKDRPGKDPAEWLARVNALKNDWEMRDLSDPALHAKLLERARLHEFGEDARVAFEELHACLEKASEGEKDPALVWSSFWNAFYGRLNKSDVTSDWSECSERAVRVLALGLGKSFQLAREAKQFGPIDPENVAKLLDKENESLPKLPVVQEWRIADAVEVWALHDARSKRFTAALDDVRVGLDVARIHQPSAWLVGYVQWVVLMGRTLDALEGILPLLPRDLDVADIDAALGDIRPRDELAHALRGERAFGNRVFERARSGWNEPEGNVLHMNLAQRLVWQLVGSRDQADYLDALTSAAQRATKPAFARPNVEEPARSSMWQPIGFLVTPALEQRFAAADTLEARLALAHVALLAYRQGAPETLKFLKDSIDPFDGRPLRCALGQGQSEGLIVFWSVGGNKIDDGGTDPGKDVVWRLKLK